MTAEDLAPPVGGARISLFGVPVDVDPPRAILARMMSRTRDGERTRVYYVNAHVLNMAEDDPGFKAVLRGGDIVLADGYGARLAALWLRERQPERMAITDYIWEFADCCSAAELSVFIVGGKPGVAERAKARLERRDPNIRIVGTHHGYLGDSRASAEAVAAIQAAKPDVVCVGMGSPMQERWIEAVSDEISAPLLFAVGAVMDFVSGEVDRPRPEWMSRSGLEWTGRLLAEPRRMWRRYLIGNPRFLLRTVRERLRRTLAS